jgi:hypothetical protein
MLRYEVGTTALQRTRLGDGGSGSLLSKIRTLGGTVVRYVYDQHGDTQGNGRWHRARMELYQFISSVSLSFHNLAPRKNEAMSNASVERFDDTVRCI